MKDASGNVVRSEPQTYLRDLFYPVPWDGRDEYGAAVPAGAYTVRMEVTDQAGNKGTSPTIDVNVSAVPLVLAGGTRTVRPGLRPAAARSGSAGATPASSVRDGRSSTTGGDDYPTQPCGTVFASTIYTPQGASFRSKSDCGWALNEARGSAVLSLGDLNAPRGLQSAQLSMRGRPTVDGEIDTAEIAFGRQGPGSQDLKATTPAVPGESVTSTPVLNTTWDATGYQGPVGVEWTIRTIGFDSLRRRRRHRELHVPDAADLLTPGRRAADPTSVVRPGGRMLSGLRHRGVQSRARDYRGDGPPQETPPTRPPGQPCLQPRLRERSRLLISGRPRPRPRRSCCGRPSHPRSLLRRPPPTLQLPDLPLSRARFRAASFRRLSPRWPPIDRAECMRHRP